MKDNAAQVINDQELYLIAFRLNTNDDIVIIYTLMVFGDEDIPMIVDNKLLFFNEPGLCSSVIELASDKIKQLGPPPENIALIYDIPRMLEIVSLEDHDELTITLNCLNIFFDLLATLKIEIPTKYKNILYSFADHLTFDSEFNLFLKEHHIDRLTLSNAIIWCAKNIFSNCKFQSSRDSVHEQLPFSVVL